MNYYGFRSRSLTSSRHRPIWRATNSFMSPTTNITDDHSVSVSVWAISPFLASRDLPQVQGNGAVSASAEDTHGDIAQSVRDGAVLGNGNTVNNGVDLHT